MTRSIRGTRRAVLLAGAAAIALLASGCGAGQIAETMLKDSATPGVNADSPDGSIQIRNLLIDYKDPKGYPAGGNAPISAAFYNATGDPVTVRISTTAATDQAARETVLAGRSVVLAGGASPSASASASESPSASGSASPGGSPGASPSASPSPSVPTEQPAVFTVPPAGSIIFRADSPQRLQVTGLDKALLPGMSVNLVFEFEQNGVRQELRLPAPMGLPLSPAPRAPRQHEGVEGGQHD